MFQLYKQRNFSALFNDTFTFLKETGKNYFKNYFIVNGPLLLILVLLVYLVGQVFFDAVFTNIGNTDSNRLIEEYFSNNFGFFFGMAALAGILLLILTLLSYSYPVIYLYLFEKNAAPTAGQIAGELKKKSGRIIIFSLLWLITFLPLMIVAGMLSILLIVIIIGIPFALVVFAGIFSWMALSFFDYLNTGNGYFTSLKKGFTILFSKFWIHAGSTAIFYIMLYMLQSIVSMIPYLFAVASVFSTSIENSNQLDGTESLSIIGIALLITLVLSMLLSYILGNIIFINQGMIYYSYRDEHENHTLFSEIDLIGQDGE